MIDTHCHIDMYSDPLAVAKECERAGIVTIGVTNLPSHFELGYEHLLNFKKVRLSLGLHPLNAELHEEEFPLFMKNLGKTSYIGEIGLDFSREGIPTKEIQVLYFDKVLQSVKDRKKILSIHSRKAEKEVLSALKKYNIKNAIFHWYSGPTSLIKEIISAGHYFSINPSMISSSNGKRIISNLPKENVLTESDGPFVKIKNKTVTPFDIEQVHSYLANIWKSDTRNVEMLIYSNFSKLLNNIR